MWEFGAYWECNNEWLQSLKIEKEHWLYFTAIILVNATTAVIEKSIECTYVHDDPDDMSTVSIFFLFLTYTWKHEKAWIWG